MKSFKIVYLLGAGRSGTTLLATILNHHPEITTIGEMHQFSEHLFKGKNCSCGKKLNECSFWSDIVSRLDTKDIDFSEIERNYNSLEKHIQIPKLLFKRQPNQKYLDKSQMIFDAVYRNIDTPYVLDSSKYIARFLLLNKSKTYPVKGIYLVRDVRGVIHSFGKKVQTSRKPFSTIVYYSLINFWGELVYRIYPNVIKIKYEELTARPEKTLQHIYSHLFNKKQFVTLPDHYKMPHIIGGNRMKENKIIKLENKHAWQKQLSKTKKTIYYIATLPFMLLNKYPF